MKKPIKVYRIIGHKNWNLILAESSQKAIEIFNRINKNDKARIVVRRLFKPLNYMSK